MASGDEEAILKSISELFADDYLCCTFGFSNCSSIIETLLLIQIYEIFISSCRTPMRALHSALQAGNLKDFLCLFYQEYIDKAAQGAQTYRMLWFLARVKRDTFTIPDRKNTGWDIWVTEKRLTDGKKLDFSQRQVFSLFINIQSSICWLPDVYSSTWMQFGFCYCKTYQQKKDLADKYRALATSNASQCLLR
jgi:hypothetical protein